MFKVGAIALTLAPFTFSFAHACNIFAKYELNLHMFALLFLFLGPKIEYFNSQKLVAEKKKKLFHSVET